MKIQMSPVAVLDKCLLVEVGDWNDDSDDENDFMTILRGILTFIVLEDDVRQQRISGGMYP